MNELISDLYSIDRKEMGRPSSRDTHLNCSDNGDIACISDSIDEDRYTTVVRNQDYKCIHLENTRPLDTMDDGWEEGLRNVTYEISSDAGEHLPRPLADGPCELRDLIDELVIDPENHPSISGRLSEEVKSQLKELGYRD
ncbi:hypothetical protein SAMN05216226_1414 [Halovenus aranensis]|uniref:Uncharacterized protein n=2 Tax=Halovenus aranensis TaxID=890420 RepID=A0A1G8ZZJ1_9EURY|nr:hypothetical protein SAMN05216226_1414 [Halovenus aranensis]